MTAHAPLFLDVAGTTLTAQDRARLAHPLVAGVILFSRNWESRAQLRALCAAIKRVRPNILIGVDQEGGRVQRFRTDGFTVLPPMRALGRMWDDDAMAGAHRSQAGVGAMRAVDTAVAIGYVLGAELRACGVDLSFAPVLDLDWGGSCVIGDRALHRDARVVTVLGQALMHGLLKAGMQHCAKHFPGHGYVKADSHTAIPVDRRSLATILRDDAAPYAWLSSTLTATMVAHVVYARVDPVPAGYSRRWLQDILRDRLHFQGAVFSDDLSMAAARVIDGQAVDVVEASCRALQAGCDALLLCNQSLGDGVALDQWLEGMAQARQQGRWQPDPASPQRLAALRPQSAALEWQALQQQPAYRLALEKVRSAV
ncbi:beta-hexosaminidase [Lampropedia cohaerens]|uniref:Beta-hexosaminidase n=1 Tax=Lampropedia cohaerens TaxID=1610491 RepID=A0A0U1PXE6_9BURK|nr:beta-N-acetylhexosaminidase [Lampropedia cohaerens]KKW67005.1 beta-hexosaminidase [Lampropedia cohaerens]